MTGEDILSHGAENAPLTLYTELAKKITSAVAVVTDLKVEQFVPIPPHVSSRIRHAGGILKIVLLEDTTMPVQEIRSFLGMPAGREASLLRNTGAFKDQLLLGLSPQRVIDPEASKLQIDTVEHMLGLHSQRQLVQLPYTNSKLGLTGGVYGYPDYELVDLTR